MITTPSQDLGNDCSLMRHALRAAGVGCWDLDLAKGSLWRSPECDSIWGTTPVHATMPLNALLASVIPEDRNEVAAVIEQAPAQRTIAIEARIQRADDNKIRWIRMTGQVYLRAEQLAGIAGVVADVTSDHLVREKLRHTEKMQSLGHMAREVAHDFNNLLMVIGANLEMLSEQIDGERANRLFSAMSHGVERGVALTQNLMDFSQPGEAEMKVIGIDQLMASTKQDLLRHAGGQVAITITPAPSTWCYCVDPSQMVRAMTNIIDNAREAMSHGGRVLISTTVQQLDHDSAANFGVPAGAYAGISFDDDGAGIAPDLIPRVFEPMFSTKQDKKGHGFGLSQVYAMASSSGGFATIESQAQRGTTITIHLPLASHVL